MSKPLRIGMVGSGYMGKAHAIAYRNAMAAFEISSESLICDMLADATPELAKQKALELGFRRSTGDWRDMINDSDIDVIDICAPNFLHKDIALAAIAAGKHVYSEKPLALNSADAKRMTEAASLAGVSTLVGFNYIKNPTLQFIKQLIEQGDIGDLVHFRGVFNEDYLAQADLPFSWRLQQEFAGSGALNDLASHLVQLALHLMGPITELCADVKIVHKQRPLMDSNDRSGRDMGMVENEDQAHMMVRFANGAQGTLETSRVAWGRKNGLSFEITGTKGSLVFDQERLSEFSLYLAGDKPDRQGFKRILVGPEHPDYKAFCVSAGHGLGFNDMKAVEIRDLYEGLVNKRRLWPDFRAATQVNVILDQVIESHRRNAWVKIEQYDGDQ
ncbi:Gfo/Idh/MocA family protein [Marinomonas posidonica]|uniref:Oxidoreductase domain protein n=1 Tax=Marinomonas posidonica (strain CECT 7376 / NCIMB 14433 / IVIA-Po-181) TaxID=491952 RepID=F6CUA1_MARPP|nr:Gfo/Idh/MocA family oxidoreductase [Marinomonas posidonica]AEF55220.1 oxidoreductase domain protein [Marinomonas posidonica IVIA-Po-181]